MPYAPMPYVEQPNLRAPICLIVDDPAPCINPLWYFRHQVDGQAEPAHVRAIPLDFMEAWCEWIAATGVRGDFTVLPFPAGLGRIDDRLVGCDVGELQAWMRLARHNVAPQFDIHCEILTHTNALNLQTGNLLPISEQDWTEAQDEPTLTEYFAAAMQILKDAGLPNNGMTQPCYFNGDESLYARALLAAEKRVNGRKVTHNFLHMDGVAPFVPPRLTHLDTAAGEAVASIWCGMDDFIWNTQDKSSEEAALSPSALADRFLTEDGTSGRLPVLLNGGGPLIMVTHWQSLFSNGSRQGLDTYREVVRRITAQFGERVEWRKLSTLTQQFVASQTVQFDTQTTPSVIEVAVNCPYDADVLTVTVPTSWPLYTGPDVSVNGQPYPQVQESHDLDIGTWFMRGSLVTVSLPLTANTTSTITITAKPRD